MSCRFGSATASAWTAGASRAHTHTHTYTHALTTQEYDVQLPALRPLPSGDPRRKVVFSTSISEMSVTIDGVRWVVDPGKHKAARFDPTRNMSVVTLARISRSSADQRKGRAGRTAPGTCVRLYSEDKYEAMPQSNVPEVDTQTQKHTQHTHIHIHTYTRAHTHTHTHTPFPHRCCPALCR